ncbi:MAG: cupin domain-containing protein [Albidovulum sp.]|nr:cupin domain-containing protein [Albidovulum sp.]MDE0303783.1 cupin domain-containing protein [Albidovulum sp.]MDE0532372.1 cupin domain-containing protein [Albidovulum sp.]
MPTATPQIQIENDTVRVTEWNFTVGAETGHHRHEHDYVIVPLTTGNLKIIDNDGKETISHLIKGKPYFRREGVEHNVINDSGTEFAFIEIELL